MKFDGICLITQDVLALADFYSRALGAKAEGDAQHAEVHTAGAHLAIFSIEGMENMAPHSMQGAKANSRTRLLNARYSALSQRSRSRAPFTLPRA